MWTEEEFNELHRENRDRVIQYLREAGCSGKGLLVVQGGIATLRYDTDHEPLFRQESTFHYLFGVRESDFVGVIAFDESVMKSILFIPKLEEEFATWMGPLPTVDDVKSRYGVDAVYYQSEFRRFIDYEWTPEVVYLHYGMNTDSGNYPIKVDLEALGMPRKWGGKIDESMAFEAIVESRVIKSDREIELMRFVNQVSSEAHIEVMKQIAAGMMEYQIESVFKGYVSFHGNCRECSYTCICGSGPNASILHYGHAGAPNDRQIKDGDMVLLDMGGEYHCYGADITCSYPVNGRFTEKQRGIYEAVRAMQLAVFEVIKPDVHYKDMHELAYSVGCLRLKDLGILRGDIKAMMEANVFSTFMPHGLGHFLGIDTHDVGGYVDPGDRDERNGYRSLRLNRVLKKGMVLTVEPGIYFINHLMDKAIKSDEMRKFLNIRELEKYRGFGGIRLEDDIVITDDGMENLTKCPREISEIENIMAASASININGNGDLVAAKSG